MRMLTHHGLRMPVLGLGTWRLSGAACVAAVQGALARGYRHIDTAQMYGNERAVGEALAASGLRGEVHLTSKVWWENLAPARMRAALEASLAALRTDHVDLYLIHWPAPGMNLGLTLESLARLREEGLARAIGVSNFPLALLRQAVEQVGVDLACLQVEYHVLLDQSKLLAYTRAHDMALTAYCPLAQGRLAEEPALADIARKHGATPAQVALAWVLEQDAVAAIPKAAREASQAANLAALELRLDDDDRAVIAGLPKDRRLVNPGFAPAWD
jgi:2,5-diketo-D-gluconate reductase B